MAYSSYPGFGFHPSEEKTLDYLKKRIHEHFEGSPSSNVCFIPDIDLYEQGPWNLPKIIEGSTTQGYNRDDWYFFCRLKEKYQNSKRLDRTVPEVGFWKATGEKRKIICEDTNNEMGTRLILVFHEGTTAKSVKTDWVIHEYHLNPSYLSHNFRNVKAMPFVASCLKRKTTDEPAQASRDEEIYDGLTSIQSI